MRAGQVLVDQYIYIKAELSLLMFRLSAIGIHVLSAVSTDDIWPSCAGVQESLDSNTLLGV